MSGYISVLRKYDDFTGRARRKEYWLFLLVSLLILFVVAIADVVLGTPTALRGMGALSSLVSVLLVFPSWAVGVRRLHDSGRSGWWLLAGLIPFVGVVVLIVLMLLPGTPGENEYGRNPRPELASA